MKNYFFLVLLVLAIFFNCKNTDKNISESIITKEFTDFNQIEPLLNYNKVSDTVLYGNRNFPGFGILHLQKENGDLILFNKITLDSFQNRTYTILDTLAIQNLKQNEFITIGYCEFENEQNENLIAIVDKTDSISIEHINAAWQVNTVTQKIESITDLSSIKCVNELND
ncbi:MAG: hypothetical protein COA80_09345 [Leeuwenhoekiella sp.]|nr:MAG: hypothetical protein COA80_09345 [Leeuwenhoekiella sp.]